MRPVDVSTEIIINRPVRDVAGFAADPDNATKWYVNIKAVTWKTPKPLRVGTQVEFTAAFLGKKLVYTYEVTELSPDKLVMRTANGPFPMETTYRWEKVSDNETRMVLRNSGMPTGFTKLVVPLMELAMKGANRKDLKHLKALLEKKYK